MRHPIAFMCFSLAGMIAAGAASAGLAGRLPSTSQPPSSLKPRDDRAAFMRQHFASVMRVHESVIRGDLATARAEARAVASRPAPPGLPAPAERT